MRTLSIGMIVCATRSEATIAITIGTATCFIRIVISLGEPNTSGTNTMIVASVPASVATPTSLTPRSVAPRGSPGVSWRCRNTLSVITTALSTSMPIASIMPIIEKMLSVRPRK